MNYLSHLKNSIKMFMKVLLCKHQEGEKSSCPFTGMTYTMCAKCGDRLKVEPTSGN